MRSEKMNQRTVKKSQFGMVMKRLAKNKMAIVGLAIVSILIIIAALADVIFLMITVIRIQVRFFSRLEQVTYWERIILDGTF